MSKLRSVCFTINNPKDIPKIKEFLATARYAVYGEEVGESGTPHLQGYVEFHNPRSFKAIHAALEKGHLERRRGTRWEASQYCKKEATVIWEHGVAPEEEMREGKRSDLDLLHEEVGEGASLRSIITSGIVRNYQGVRMMEKLLSLFEIPRRSRPKVYWYWGKSGTGKSYTAGKEAEAIGDVYYSNGDGKWWDGYDRHKCVVINDFRQDWLSWSQLLMLLDEQPYRVEVKGGMRQFVAEHIWITCPKRPEREFQISEDLSQLTSRLTEMREFLGVNQRQLERNAEHQSKGNTIPLTVSEDENLHTPDGGGICAVDDEDF